MASYENHQATLFKLHQFSSVAEYQAAFEKLSNRILGLPSDALLNCFILVLCPEIQRELALHQTFSLSQTLGLVKLIEGKLPDTPSAYRKYNAPQTTPTTSLLPKPPPSILFPIRRLSPTEMQARRSKGLCFNCDDKWHAGHNMVPNSFCYFSVMMLRTETLLNYTNFYPLFLHHQPIYYPTMTILNHIYFNCPTRLRFGVQPIVLCAWEV